jgi:hypothetical protein
MVHRTYITAHWRSLTYAFERTFTCGSVVHSKITCTVSGASGCCWSIVTIQGSTYTDHRGRSPVQESLQLKDTRCYHYHRNCMVDWKVAPTGSRAGTKLSSFCPSEIECETWTSSAPPSSRGSLIACERCK